jgi:hypothetical protein
MSGDTDCTAWRDLEDDAQAEAAESRPSADGWARIARAVEAVRAQLGGEDARSHTISFDPEKWQPYASALPEQALRTKCISRGDVFEIAAQPASAEGNWRLFCSSYIWGHGPNGYGRTRIERIIRTTPPQQLSAVIASARACLAACGPLSAYASLRGTGSACTAPHWGPAFFTKLLYFVDAPSAAGSALILDNLTATAVADISGLPHLVNKRGGSGRWTGYRYGVYLAWMNLVAAELHVSPDFLEYALFEEGRRRRKQRPS